MQAFGVPHSGQFWLSVYSYESYFSQTVTIQYSMLLSDINFHKIKQEIFFLYFGMHYDTMCNEIEYAMLEEYLAKVKQKDAKEKEPKKQTIEVAA